MIHFNPSAAIRWLRHTLRSGRSSRTQSPSKSNNISWNAPESPPVSPPVSPPETPESDASLSLPPATPLQSPHEDSCGPSWILSSFPASDVIDLLIPQLLLTQQGVGGIRASFPRITQRYYPPRFFHNVGAVTAEFRRVSELRELLRIEEILLKVEATTASTGSYGKGALSELERLIARACDGILLLQKGCMEQGLALDFDEIERRRHSSMPDNHPYKVLLAYMDCVGVE